MTKKYRLFDCDDTLFLSESLAFAACCGVVNKVLADKDVRESDGSLKAFTPAGLKKRFVGHSFREMILALSREFPPFTIDDAELDKLVADELAAVTAKLRAEVEKTDGVDAVLARVQSRGEVPVVVSSSAISRVLACLERGQLEAVFGERVFSAASLTPPSSKPDPAVYLEALRVLGVTAEECIAYEDSVSGVTAAVRAGIEVIGYVGALPADQQVVRAQALIKAGAVKVIYSWSEFEG